MKKERKVDIKEVIVEAIATDDGYYKGSIIKTGQKFNYEGIIKDGKYPLWLSPVGEPKFKKEIKKAKPVEADVSDLV